MTFTIWFVGFITHVLLTDGSRRAVLVSPGDVKHEALLVVRHDEVVSNTPDFSPLHDDGEIAVFDLADRSLVITPIKGPVDTGSDSSFASAVPSLRVIANKAKLVPEVLRGETNDHIAGYVDYGGGFLAVQDYMLDDATFDKDVITRRCVAKTVRFTASTSSDIVILDRYHPGARLTLKGYASIRIRNLPAEQGAEAHFDEYNWITEAPYKDFAMIHMNSHACVNKLGDKAHAGGTPPDLLDLRAVSVDCVNTTYP